MDAGTNLTQSNLLAVIVLYQTHGRKYFETSSNKMLQSDLYFISGVCYSDVYPNVSLTKKNNHLICYNYLIEFKHIREN